METFAPNGDSRDLSCFNNLDSLLICLWLNLKLRYFTWYLNYFNLLPNIDKYNYIKYNYIILDNFK